MCVLFNARHCEYHVTVFLPPSPLPGGPNPTLFLSFHSAEQRSLEKASQTTYTSATSSAFRLRVHSETNKQPQTSKSNHLLESRLLVSPRSSNSRSCGKQKTQTAARRTTASPAHFKSFRFGFSLSNNSYIHHAAESRPEHSPGNPCICLDEHHTIPFRTAEALKAYSHGVRPSIKHT
jgi:hypothetical protein